MRFEDIIIDKTAIPQSELNIDYKKRSNLFPWNGQFSPQFIETLLKKYAEKSDVIVDPFVGSGTTLFEAARMGISAYGMELNVSAFYMAKTYELANVRVDARNDIINHVEREIKIALNSIEIVPSIIQTIHENPSTRQADILCTLVVLLDLYNNEVTPDFLQNKWDNLKNIINKIPYSSAKITADLGDARKLNCNDDSATLLITSPPYINVFNYHQKYRRSVEELGFDVLTIARKEFGSNRKNRGNRLLTVIQYCIDMALSIKEAIRVCRSDARMIYVVGRESTVLGYSFCNSQLIYEISTEIFGLPFLLRQERVFKNRFGQQIFEDILHFRNSKINFNLSNEEIECGARNIAVRLLTIKYESQPNSKNIDLILRAITEAENVKRSED